jgi:hypothetical protein
MTAMDTLSKILSEAKASGVYHPAQSADEIARAAKEAKLSIVRLDLGTVPGKSGVSCAARQSVQIPHFGMNWDASDCLTDLSWLDDHGWVVILFNGRLCRQPETISTPLCSKLRPSTGAVAKPFWVLVYGDAAPRSGLPRLPKPSP